MTDGIIAKSTTITGHGGDEIEAYLAHPLDGGGQPGVVVLHHMPGYDRATKEIVRHLRGLRLRRAFMPNLHHRYALGAKAGDAAVMARDAGGVPDEQCLGDARAAIDAPGPAREQREGRGDRHRPGPPVVHGGVQA